MKRLGVVLLILFALTLNSVSQVNGDYQTRASGNWNANTTWQVYNGGWVNCGAGDYPGATAGAGTVNLLDNNTVTVTANVPNSIGSLRIDGGGNDSYLQFNAGFSLTVTGLTYLNSNSNNDEKSVLVDAGVFRTGSIDAYSSGNSRDAYIRISTGNVTVDGDVTLNSTNVRTYILFTGTGTLFVGGTMNGGGITSTVGGGAAAPTSGTVNYNALGAQTVGTYTYYNLTLSGSGAKTTTGVTVNNILSMEETATASVAPTYGAAATLQYNTATNRTAGVEWITPFAATGGVIIDNTGVITMDAAKVFNASIPLNINSGATLATNDLQLTLGGNFVNSGGTFTAGSSPIIITNNSAQSITGFTTTGLISMTKTGGTATLTGNVNGGALTMNGAGTLNLGAGLTHTITGTWTRTNGTLNGGSSTLLLGGSVSGVGGTFTANTSTVEYYGAGLQDVGALTYYKLTISGGSIKTMLGNVIVSNTITLNSGILRTGNFNLTISGNPTNSIQGTLNSTSMVETNGTGLVIRNAAAATPILFPIGSNGNYAPATINSTSATTGTITVTTIQSGALGAKYVERYWDVITTTGGKTITATFQYDPSEITVTPTFLKYKPTAGVWQDPVGTQSFGTNTFTITGTTNITTTTTSWTAGALGTYYSYQTGDWNTPTTWTSDPGGTTQVGSTVPGINDVVVILTGRTVSLPADIATSGLDVTINAGGYLNMSTYQFTSGLEALRGQGTLKLASINFPTVTTNTLVNTGGGTVEYNNATNFNLPVAQTTYNNLTINAPGVVATQMNNLTLNGNLYVKQGTYRINDNTAARRQLTINGDVIVDNGASLTVGDGVTNTTTNPYGINGGTPPFINYYDAHSHRVVINGDFTNNGTVRFTNLTYPVYNAFPPTVIGATTGFATVYFQGATNNTLTCNNTTDFYNLVLDKGIDQTFSLTVYSSAYTNFRLFGANISGGDQTAPATANNPNLKKALWIRTGTLKLQGLTIIPSLSEGTCGDGATPNSDFYIPANGAFVLDGTDVIVLSTADDYREVNLAYGVSGGTGLVNGVGQGGCSSFSILGKLQINNGYFSTRESGGFITWDWASGQFIINGGTVDAKQYRAAGGTGGLASYTQTGGLFILRGRFWRTPTAFTAISNLTDFSTATLNTARSTASIDPAVGAFNLNNAANVFNMSGGTIQIYDVLGNAAAEQKAFEIKSATGNINVTGGTLEVIPTTGTLIADPANYYIESNASLGNFTVNRASGSSVVGLRTYPLTVITNLNITSGDFNANSLDVAIGGNFTISAGTTYTTGTNRTIFNGLGSQTITLNTASPLSFNKLIVNKLNPTRELRTLGTQNTIIIVDSLKILVGIFRTYNNTIYCSGNIENNSTSLTAAGYLVMNSDAAQTISGNGNGIFTNLELNKSMVGIADVTLLNNITINGDLKFSGSATGYKKLDLQDKNLLFGTNATVTGADVNRFAYTKGEIGNASISKIYSATSNSFTFPIGAPSTSHVGVPVYTPTTIGFSTDPTAYGTISVVPVGAEHYATSVKNRCLTYYWHVKSTGFAGIAAGSVNHSYTYSDLDVATGADITENEYVPARFDLNSVTWTNGTTASINTATNVMDGPWLSGVDNIDGDYTAGDNNLTSPFGTPTTYYSYSSGWWGDVANWSLTDHTTSNPPAVPPGASDIVIIGNGHAITLNTNNTVANTDIRSCANLQIEAGASLDIGYNPGCTFTVVSSFPSGNGLFRLTTSWTSGSTYVFPSGDFSDFNVNLGTTELYSTNPAAGTTYWLPNGITSYGNLILSPLGGSNIIFPNNDLLIYGNLITQGQNADSWFCPTWNVTYPTAPTAVVAKTITINGDLDIQGGGLIWYGNGALAQNFVVNGDVKVATLAALYVWPGGGANNQRMSIGGSLINNTDGLAHGLTTTSKCDFTTIPLTFFGSNSASITNTAGNPSTIFSTVIINKGTSQATTLTCDIAGTLTTPVNNWLTLQNGTLIYQRTGDLAITTSSIFTIPGTAGLTVNTPSDVNIANAASNANDLYLNGKLTVINGRVFVGREIGTDNNNNDIEYSGGGLSEIDMQGGSLIVNGQIRMNSASTAGVLMYRQSGSSSVIINGQNAVTSNAKLEIYNPGSVFNMSGTSTLTIVRGGGGNTYGDLYLRPASSSVSGTSTVYFTQTPTVGPVVDVVQNYQLDATVPLNYLTITGKTAATARNATVKLLINPITINGDLTISNANSFFDANTTYNIGVTIKGNLSNSGTYNHYNNTTTFSGSSQSILGTTATSFHNLIVNPVTSLTLNANTIVSNDLTLTSGILICGGYTVNVAGNLINNANYTDINTGVVLNGTTLQRISGTGTFGRLTLNNTAGARLNNNISLTNDLVLTTGIFDINQYLLTLGVSSNITGAPFGPTKMIASDGVFSAFGIKKVFGIIAAPITYTFPIGTATKYTPAILTINNNDNVGWVRINNINSAHPGVFDPSNVLKYFWEVESFGLSNFTGNLVFNYLDADIVGGPESSYISARLLTPGTSWSKLTTVDPVLNTFTFNYTGTDNVNGEYTAGLDPAFPADVPEYTSIADGIWTDETNWVQTGGSTIYPCPVGGPNGFIVNINHIITANADYCQAYRTVINSELKIVSPYTGHNLGTVTGNGTLLLESATFPAGRYTSFLDCSGNGTIEYGGNSSYTIIADLYSSVPRLYFTGTGTKTLPNKDLTICKRLLIDGVMLDNTLNNSKLTIQGTMERINSGIFASGSGANATVSFSGSTAQTVGGATLGNFTGTSAFNNLEINNSAGLTINNPGSIEVKGNLLLTSGLINTSSTATLTITNTAIGCVTPAGGSATSYVNGPLTKRINQGDNFFYPLGKGATAGNMLTLSSTQVGTILWTAEYFTPNSTYTNLTAPLSYVNSKDFWTVSAPSGSQAIVNLKWNPTSDLTPLMTQNGLSDMRVAYYNSVTPSWEEVASSASGDDNNGTVSTTSRVTIPATGSSNYTVACINVTKPKARLNPTGAVCGIAGIPISFSGVNATNLNFIINYKKGGIAQAPVTVNSLPYSLPTDATGTTYQLTSFTYNNPPHSAPVETGVVDASIITTYTVPTTANAGPDQSLCGASSATLAGNLPVIGTGLWSYSGAGGSFDDPTDRNTVFHGTNGTAYVLQWTITNGGCTSFADVNITFPLLAVQPAGFSASTTPVCQGTSGVVYTVPNDPLVTYVWSYSGTNANIIGSLNSITVDYLGNATSGDLSVRAHNGCGDSAPLTLSITVKVSPTATLSVDGGFNLLCDGDNTQITVTITGGTSPYDFDIYNGAATENFTNIVSPYTFIPSVANFPVWTGPTASNTYTYSVPTVTSANGCSNAGSNTVDVVVNKRPETGPQYHIPNSMGL